MSNVVMKYVSFCHCNGVMIINLCDDHCYVVFWKVQVLLSYMYFTVHVHVFNVIVKLIIRPTIISLIVESFTL